MIVAERRVPIGDTVYERGQEVPHDVVEALPARRLEQLLDLRYVKRDDRDVGNVGKALAELEQAVTTAVGTLHSEVEVLRAAVDEQQETIADLRAKLETAPKWSKPKED